jgi:hypothetical protein
MRFTWPPSEQSGWDIQTYHQKQKEKPFFLPLQKQDQLLLAIRITANKSTIPIEIPLVKQKGFTINSMTGEWSMLPFPIEQHAIGCVWETMEVPVDDCVIDLAYFPWTTRNFRMRALVDTEGKMLFAYRINKKGLTDIYMPPKDHVMTLPEDTYIVPPTSLINNKSILLVSSQSKLEVKKIPESRYFCI